MVEAFCQRFEGFMDRFIRTETTSSDGDGAEGQQKISAEMPRFKDPKRSKRKPHPMNDLWREAVLKTQNSPLFRQSLPPWASRTRLKNCKTASLLLGVRGSGLDKTGIPVRISTV
ncbi:hypothetical protein BV898_17165 [Hypsibius exemplaris]|uniref:Uncharacterized protein n=1 Tax=Hypsibius exemplaris TaxID=2072580 RepID=A0A9X6NN61_HYPEX|nr:hypothetical protein BV898_17165 [Hypsibius exemplaris]